MDKRTKIAIRVCIALLGEHRTQNNTRNKGIKMGTKPEVINENKIRETRTQYFNVENPCQ